MQQISTRMDDMSLAEVSDAARLIVCSAKPDPSQFEHAEGLAERLDIWPFVPHYPYPPPSRDWALGLQAAGTEGALHGMFLVVHTTHALQMGTTTLRHPDYFCYSNSMEQPVWRVMLWYNNPYHM